MSGFFPRPESQTKVSCASREVLKTPPRPHRFGVVLSEPTLPPSYGPPGGLRAAALWWTGFVWSSPNTLVGLLIGALCLAMPEASHGALNYRVRRGPVRWVCDLLGISAFTVGDCILYRAAPRDRIRAHELRHVAQYRLLGPLFLPSYFLMLAVFGYHAHPLERDARRWEARWVRQNSCGTA